MNPTERLYLTDTFQYENSAEVLEAGMDEHGPYLVPDASVFYPGGGGQEPDQGMVIRENGTAVPLLKAALVLGAFRHYTAAPVPEGERLIIRIDGAARVQHARLHTGGHLLSSVVFEQLKWPLIPVKGFHYTEGAYLEFKPMEVMNEPDLALLNQALEAVIGDRLSVTSTLTTAEDRLFREAFKPPGFQPPPDKPLRLVKIDTFLAYPCGGTHLRHTGELHWLRVRHVKNKKGNIRIAYEAG